MNHRHMLYATHESQTAQTKIDVSFPALTQERWTAKSQRRQGGTKIVRVFRLPFLASWRLGDVAVKLSCRG